MSNVSRAIIAAVALAAAMPATAMAGNRHVNVHVGNYFQGNFGHGHHSSSGIYINVGGSGGCGYSYDRWQDTGSYYWKKRYYECKGWW
jgi:hypothetical protein